MKDLPTYNKESNPKEEIKDSKKPQAEYKSKGLDDTQLSELVMSYYDESTNNEGSLQKSRRTTLSAYRREKYGDEDPNWSQVITSDIRDTVAWFLPVLLEVFFGPDFPAKFSARNEQDIDQAQLETDYTLNVINQQNNGFLMMYIWLKDALIQKNGYVHAYWDERVDEEVEEYDGISDLEYIQLTLDPDIEITEHTIIDGNGNEIGEDEVQEGMLTQGFTHNVKVVRTEDNSKICIDNIPPEGIFLDTTHTSVDLSTVSCVGYETEVSRSDLIVDGYDEDMVNSLSCATDLNDTEEKNERDEFNFEKQAKIDQARKIDPSRDKIRIIQAYIRADADGDGRAELLFVKLAGNQGEEVLEKKPVSSVRIYACTPEVEPHQHFGTSVAELVEDLQRIRTVITRQLLNNLYLANHPQTEYVKGQVDYNDLISRAPGSTIGVKAIGMLNVHTTPFTAQNSLPIFDELTRRTEARTGISETTQGLNAEALSKATNIVGTKILNAAQARLQLVARLILETGFKGMFRGVHEIACQFDRERLVEFGSGKYQKVNPRLWRKRTALNVEMGPGFADKASKLLLMQTIQQIQEKIIAAQQGDGPLLNQKQIYNSLTDMCRVAGIMNPNRYFSDPEQYTPPPKDPNNPDPISEALQIEKMRLAQKDASDKAQREQELLIHEDKQAWTEFEGTERLRIEEEKASNVRKDSEHGRKFVRPSSGKQKPGADGERSIPGSDKESKR